MDLNREILAEETPFVIYSDESATSDPVVRDEDSSFATASTPLSTYRFDIENECEDDMNYTRRSAFGLHQTPRIPLAELPIPVPDDCYEDEIYEDDGYENYVFEDDFNYTRCSNFGLNQTSRTPLAELPIIAPDQILEIPDHVTLFPETVYNEEGRISQIDVITNMMHTFNLFADTSMADIDAHVRVPGFANLINFITVPMLVRIAEETIRKENRQAESRAAAVATDDDYNGDDAEEPDFDDTPLGDEDKENDPLTDPHVLITMALHALDEAYASGKMPSQLVSIASFRSFVGYDEALPIIWLDAIMDLEREVRWGYDGGEEELIAFVWDFMREKFMMPVV